MIGSPWNPFFEQSVPGTRKRYDGRLVDSHERQQMGAFNLISCPPHLEMVRNKGTHPTSSDSTSVILERKFGLVNGGDVDIETEVAAYGILYNSELVQSIRDTGFCWWQSNQLSWNNKIPRMYYEQVNDTSNFKWRFGASFAHTGINHPENALVLPPSNWRETWTLWQANDFPKGDFGEPDAWVPVPGVTLFDPGETPLTYPLFFAKGKVDNDIPAGSRIRSPIDLNYEFELTNITTSLTGEKATLRPWYRSG